MNAEWEAVEPVRDGAGEVRAYASLNRRGEIALNDAAWRLLRSSSNVQVYVDRERQRIGLKMPFNRSARMFPFRRYGRGGRMRVVRIGRILKKFGIEIGQTLVFENLAAERHDDGAPMIVLTVNSEW